jgi:hypothetical protein
MEIDVTHFDTLTRLVHQKSSNLMHFQKTDEGTVGAPTCLPRSLKMLRHRHLKYEEKTSYYVC